MLLRICPNQRRSLRENTLLCAWIHPSPERHRLHNTTVSCWSMEQQRSLSSLSEQTVPRSERFRMFGRISFM